MTGIDIHALAEAYERALACEKAGDREGAAAGYARVLALDPEDRAGAAVRLAAMGLGPAPAAAPPAYVATLFDQQAERFDAMLVEQLGYHVPIMLRERLGAARIGRIGRLLDLGCGTGLTGDSLADITDHATGCDLSEDMLAMADAKGAYDALYIADAVGFLESWAADGEAPFDLIAATDMLPYLGLLEPLIAGAARCLAPGGYVAVSTETLPSAAFEGRDFVVGPKRRYAHAERYLRACLEAEGFAVIAFDPITVRHDEGVPVPGHLVLARR